MLTISFLMSNSNFSQRDKYYFFIKEVVFHRVGISWMIATKEQYHFSVDEQYEELCTGWLWFNERLFWNIRAPLFELFFVAAHEDRYDLMCLLHAYKKPK